jgi:nickel/cobalt transporter (NicO) family protein
VGEAFLFLASSFWLGAFHAATPGHGKTIAAAYIVGARGRPVDALILGIFVTLSHTSGIVLVAVLASLGSGYMVPQRVEAYLALATGLIVILIGLWTLWTQRRLLSIAAIRKRIPDPVAKSAYTLHVPGSPGARSGLRAMAYTRVPGAQAALRADRSGEGGKQHAHHHDDHHTHSHDEFHNHDEYHSHGWGRHTHRLDDLSSARPSLIVLLGLGVAGGLLPDPAALALLLGALGQGKVLLGLGTVVVFSVGFAATLVVVGVVAAQVGKRVLTWLSGPWAARIQIATSLLIVVLGLALSIGAWRSVNAVL